MIPPFWTLQDEVPRPPITRTLLRAAPPAPRPLRAQEILGPREEKPNLWSAIARGWKHQKVEELLHTHIGGVYPLDDEEIVALLCHSSLLTLKRCAARASLFGAASHLCIVRALS